MIREYAVDASIVSVDDAEPDSCIYDLDSYGSSLKPTITRELQDRINATVNDAYNDIKK